MKLSSINLHKNLQLKILSYQNMYTYIYICIYIYLSDISYTNFDWDEWWKYKKSVSDFQIGRLYTNKYVYFEENKMKVFEETKILVVSL